MMALSGFPSSNKPSALASYLAVGADATDENWQAKYNDATCIATKVDWDIPDSTSDECFKLEHLKQNKCFNASTERTY